MRKRTVFISFFTSCTQPCPSDLSARTHPAEMLASAFEHTRDFRRLHRLSQSARTHVTHRMCARTQITWSVVTMGNCLIWISLCMFFFPLIETVTYTCHYMTDRLERFDLKISKLDLLNKIRHLHLGCPWGKLIDTKF